MAKWRYKRFMFNGVPYYQLSLSINGELFIFFVCELSKYEFLVFSKSGARSAIVVKDPFNRSYALLGKSGSLIVARTMGTLLKKAIFKGFWRQRSHLEGRLDAPYMAYVARKLKGVLDEEAADKDG